MKCTLRQLVIFLLLFSAHTYSFAQDINSVVVLPKNMAAPADAKKIGTITFGNNSTQVRCDYEAELKAAKIKARKMGGNIIKITALIDPNFISKCYRIKADVYSGNVTPYEALSAPDRQTDTVTDAAPHATLYIYRLPDTTAFAMTYELHLDNDSEICKIKSRTARIVHLYKEGNTKLWGKIEKEKSVVIDVKFGQTYYLRCGTEQGQVIGVPVLKIVNNKEGVAEYEKLTAGKKDLDESYLNDVH